MGRVHDLVQRLGDADSLAIVCHDTPDPDCIASALALEIVASVAEVARTEILHGGNITHQQNRAFVNVLDIEMRDVSEVDLEAYDSVAFVDHSRPGSNTQADPNVAVDIVVDHHSSDDPVDAPFADVREVYGATSSILVEYLTELGVDVPTKPASALLFALHRERLDYMRSPTRHEYGAAHRVFPRSDLDLIRRMYDSEFTPTTLDAIGEAIRGREIRGSSLVTSVGRTTERDTLAQAADYLLNLEGVDTVLVSGVVDETLYLSARSIDSRIRIGNALRESFADIGQVGGHRDMAGASVPLDLFSETDEEEGDDPRRHRRPGGETLLRDAEPGGGPRRRNLNPMTLRAFATRSWPSVTYGVDMAENRAEFTVRGLASEDDVREVRAELEAVDGVMAIEIDPETGEAKVDYDYDLIAEEQIERALRDAGHEIE